MWISLIFVLAVFLLASIATRAIREGHQAESRAASYPDPIYKHQPVRSYPHRLFSFRLDLFFEIVHDILARRFTEGVRRRFTSYGTTFSAYLAYRRLVCTIDPENLETLMRTKFDDYTIIKDRQKLVRLVYGDGVFSTTGKDWQHSRKMIRGAMARADLSVDMLSKHAENTIDEMKAEANGNVDMAKAILAYTMGVSSEIILGEDPSEEAKAFKKNFAHYGTMAIKLTLWVDPIPFAERLFFGTEFQRTKSAVHGYVDRIIRSDPRDMSSAKGGMEPLARGMSRYEQRTERVRSECLNLLLAGRDTVGTGIIELFWLLARHPDAWEKLRQEVIGAEISSLSDLRSLKYLGSVINEGLRLRPALAVHAKKAVVDTVLPRGGGDAGSEPMFVSKGTFVLYSNYALHRNKVVFGADVDDFRPERWEAISPFRYEYLNFGAGPRHCPGKEMGWAMVALFTLKMAQTFETIRPADERPWVEGWSFTFGNKNGLHVCLG